MSRNVSHTSWHPCSREDWEHVRAACDELINYTTLHEDAEPKDREPMHRAMQYVANRLDVIARRATVKSMGLS